MPTIIMPDGVKVKFPDNTPPEQIQAAIERSKQAPPPGPVTEPEPVYERVFLNPSMQRRAERQGNVPLAPRNVQRVTEGERRDINILGPNNDAVISYLKNRGYDAIERYGRVLVRKPGEKLYGKVEPEGFFAGKTFAGNVAEFARDIGTDAVDEYAKMIAGLSSPLTAGASTAGLELARQGGARMAGFPVNLGEALKAAATEGVVTAGGSALAGGGALGAKKIAPYLKAGQEKVEIEAALEGTREGIRGARGNKLTQELEEVLPAQQAYERAGIATTQARATSKETLNPLKTEATAAKIATRPTEHELLVARAVETNDRAAVLRLRDQAMADMEARLQSVAKETDGAIQRGRELAATDEIRPITVSRKTRTETPLQTASALDLPAYIASPDFGWTAAAIQREPEIGEIIRRAYGREAVPTFADGVKRGSHNMRIRAEKIRALLKAMGPEKAAAAHQQYLTEISAFMRARPNLFNGLDEAAKEAITTGARGGRLLSPAQVQTVLETSETHFLGSVVSPELKAAKGALRKSTIARTEASGAHQQVVAEAKDAANVLESAKAEQDEAVREALLQEERARLIFKTAREHRLPLIAAGKAAGITHADTLAALSAVNKRYKASGLGRLTAAFNRTVPFAGEAIGLVARKPLHYLGRLAESNKLLPFLRGITSPASIALPRVLRED